MPFGRCVRCATCDGFPCLVHAKSDAEVLGRPPGARASERHAAHERRGACGWRRTRRARPSPAWWSSATARARRSRATSSSSPAARRTAPSCCSRRRATPTPAAWPTARTRSGATTCSTTARPCWRCRRSRTRRCSRRRSGSTTSTSARADFDYPLGNIQMVGKSSAQMYRGEKPLQTKLAPGAHARAGRAPRGRLLALDRGPAAPGEPRDAARRTAASRSPTRPPTTCPSSGSTTS